jgi:hypothetical protein
VDDSDRLSDKSDLNLPFRRLSPSESIDASDSRLDRRRDWSELLDRSSLRRITALNERLPFREGTASGDSTTSAASGGVPSASSPSSSLPSGSSSQAICASGSRTNAGAGGSVSFVSPSTNRMLHSESDRSCRDGPATGTAGPSSHNTPNP